MNLFFHELQRAEGHPGWQQVMLVALLLHLPALFISFALIAGSVLDGVQRHHVVTW